MISDEYDCKVDIWSLGILLYVMLSGFMPFGGNNTSETLNKVKRAVYDFNLPVFDKTSDSCKNLLIKMMYYYPDN